MSFREIRNFTEMMRALGYQRLISVENFRTPNFQLVADVLYWMVVRYDPLVNISDNIDTVDDRVDFLTKIAQVMASKARISLKTKNLYAADGRAVKELLKVASMLYRAMKENRSAGDAEKKAPDAEPSFALPPGMGDFRATRGVATEITNRGVKLYELLAEEEELRNSRMRALRFLDAISSNLDSRGEHERMENSIRDAIAEIQSQAESLERQVSDLQRDKKSLESKIKKRTSELERFEKRLKALQSVRPAFMDEYEKLEAELAEEYEVYLEKFRNLDYLEHEMDVYNRREKEKVEASNKQLRGLQDKWRAAEEALITGEGDGRAARGAPAAGRPGGATGGRYVAGDMRKDDISDDSSLSGSDSTGSLSDDGEVSYTRRGSGDGSIAFDGSTSDSDSIGDSSSLGSDDSGIDY